MPPTRKSIGTYEVVRPLGEGGMGVVYLARQPALERQVVVKGLRRDQSGDPSSEERFRREAQAAASVLHQNVVAVHDCFTWRGERFIAQEYVEGVDLATALETARRLEPRIAALVALELARGLEEIHARGIVHRDLKPSNVLLGVAGEVKIADFGIALDGKGPGLTQTGHAVGTPAYMSPEQLAGERVDPRSDLFGFGILLYEMLTGEPPFQTDEDGAGLLRQMESERYPSVRRLSPETPRWLARLARRCLRARLRRRIGAATELRRLLERHLGALPPTDTRAEIAGWLWEHGVFEQAGLDVTRSVPRPPRRWRLPPQLRWALAAGVGASIVAVAATGWLRIAALPSLLTALELALRP